MSDILELRNASEIRGAFLAKGATSPATAQPGKYLGSGTPAFEFLLRRGVIREGAPGNYYLYENETKTGAGHLLRAALFWAFVILMPLVIIQYCPRPH